MQFSLSSNYCVKLSEILTYSVQTNYSWKICPMVPWRAGAWAPLSSRSARVMVPGSDRAAGSLFPGFSASHTLKIADFPPPSCAHSLLLSLLAQQPVASASLEGQYMRPTWFARIQPAHDCFKAGSCWVLLGSLWAIQVPPPRPPPVV